MSIPVKEIHNIWSVFLVNSFLALVVLFVCFSTEIGFAAGPTWVDQDRIAKIEMNLSATPMGFGPVCSDRRAWTSPTILTRLQPVVAEADKLLSQKFPSWDDAAYLEYSVNGNRRNGERMMYARKSRLAPLVLAECVTGTGRYLSAIEQALNELVNQPTWTLPASDTDLKNFRNRDYEVELLAADTAHDISQALYMLGKSLTPSLLDKTINALKSRVLDPFRRTILQSDSRHSWLGKGNNWNAVCLKGVVNTALTVLPDRRDRSLFAAAGEFYIKNYVDWFAPDGYAYEGPAYWNFGFSHFIELRESLFNSTQGLVDIFKDKRVLNIALYGYRIEMIPGNIAAFGDASPKTRIDNFSRAYVNQVFLLGHSERLQNLPIILAKGASAPLANATLLLFANPAQIVSKGSIHKQIGLQSYFDSVGVLVSRPNTGKKLAVSIKAGGNASHSHNDIGSYTIALGEEQPTGDSGSTVYSGKTFSKDRYSIRAINSWGHPVPVVDGELQQDATKLKQKILNVYLTDVEDGIKIDMSSAYKVTGVRSLTRTLLHRRSEDGLVIIEDHFEFTTPKTFEMALITTGNWKQLGEGKLDIWQSKEHLLAQIEASAPYTLVSEKIEEEGLVFTRISVRLKTVEREGYVRIKYKPLSMK